MSDEKWDGGTSIEEKAAMYARDPLRAILYDLRQGIKESEHCYNCDCGYDHPRERLMDAEACLAALVAKV